MITLIGSIVKHGLIRRIDKKDISRHYRLSFKVILTTRDSTIINTALEVHSEDVSGMLGVLNKDRQIQLDY